MHASQEHRTLLDACQRVEPIEGGRMIDMRAPLMRPTGFGCPARAQEDA